jgi:phosphinothricin acetyltransferase
MSGHLIRAAVQSDLAALTALYNHYIQHTAITFDTEPWTLEQRAAWLSHYAESGRHRLLIAESEGKLLGYASSSPFRPKAAYDTSVETSVYVSPEAHGHGIGTALYTRLFEILSHEDVHRAIAGITLPNEKSLALHTKFGFVETGRMTEVGRKFNQYWDVAWMEKDVHLKPTRRKEPGHPRD